MSEKNVRMVLEVSAGLVPGQPEQKFTKQFVILSDDWHNASRFERIQKLGNLLDDAHEYAIDITDPNKVNWVRTDWIYF
jgi:hypothetical protein